MHGALQSNTLSVFTQHLVSAQETRNSVITLFDEFVSESVLPAGNVHLPRIASSLCRLFKMLYYSIAARGKPFFYFFFQINCIQEYFKTESPNFQSKTYHFSPIVLFWGKFWQKRNVFNKLPINTLHGHGFIGNWSNIQQLFLHSLFKLDISILIPITFSAKRFANRWPRWSVHCTLYNRNNTPSSASASK